MELFETLVNKGVPVIIHCLELMGVVIILFGALKNFFTYFFGKDKGNVRLELAQAMSLGLEFKLGGEILRTVVVRTLSEISIVGAIIVLRAALTLLIHWEIKHMENEHKEKEAK
ncbi:MAG: DUF1622 domain-containing protein [Clostridia bacterium]|nr:DUF1622 domain-containing protein [Clostridia bacterium]